MARKRKSTHSGLSVHWPVLSSSALPLSRSYRAFSTLRSARRSFRRDVQDRIIQTTPENVSSSPCANLRCTESALGKG